MLLSNLFYSSFFKKERKAHNLTTKALSEMMNISVGAINSFENDKDIFSNPKLKSFLSIYGYDPDTFDFIENKLAMVVDDLIKAITFVNRDEAKETYILFISCLNQCENMDISFLKDAISFVYFRFSHQQKNITSQLIDLVTENKDFLSNKYQGVVHVYLGRHYSDLKEYDKAKECYDLAEINIAHSHYFSDMYHYSLSDYYASVFDIMSSIKESNQAIAEFTKAGNYRRLLNTRITIGVQYLKMKDYKRALEINKETYDLACQYHISHDIRASMYNSGFIHVICRNYQEALECFEKIPEDEIILKDEIAKMLVYFIVEDYKKSESACMKASQLDINNKYTMLIEIFNKFYTTQNYDNLIMNFEKYILKIEDGETKNTNEFYLTIMIECNLKLGRYKKAYQYLDKLYQTLVS